LISGTCKTGISYDLICVSEAGDPPIPGDNQAENESFRTVLPIT